MKDLVKKNLQKPFTRLNKKSSPMDFSYGYSVSSSTSSFSSPLSSPLRVHKHLNMRAATKNYLSDGLEKPLHFDYSTPNGTSKITSSPFERKKNKESSSFEPSSLNFTDCAESKYTYNSTVSPLHSSRRREPNSLNYGTS